MVLPIQWYSLPLSFQLSWCSQVFPDPLLILSSLFSQALDTLDPPLTPSLHSALRGTDNPLASLTDLRQAALRFVKGLERALGGLQGKYSVRIQNGDREYEN